MKVRQWEIWKTRPEGFAADHWCVVISGRERLDSVRHHQINGLACLTLRGSVASNHQVTVLCTHLAP